MTQYSKILKLMGRYPDRWFYPYDFMKPELGGLYVGYKAPTRISELSKEYPDMFLEKPDGKYVVRKLNLEKINLWYYTLTNTLKKALREEGLTPKETPNESLSRLGMRLADE